MKQKTYPQMPLPAGEAWRALIALCIGFFMILLDQTIVAVATPAFQHDLEASYSQVVWVTSVYLLFFAVPLLVTGRLGDRYGPKNVYIAGMTLFTVMSLACGLSSSIEMLIISRALQGLGAALLTPQTMSVINRIFPREKRGAALGIWGATAGLSTMSGPVAGGVITTLWSWQWIFFVNIPIGIISVITVAAWVPRFKPLPRPIDGQSMILSMLAMFAFVFAILQGESAHWAWWIWVMLAAGAIITYLFLRRQKHLSGSGNEPLLPLELFNHRDFSYGNIGIVAMGFTSAGMNLPIMIFLQEVHGMSALASGMVMVPTSIISTVLAPFVGRLVDRIDPRPVATIGFLTMATAIALLVVVMRPGVGLAWIFVPMVVMGLGHSGVWTPNSTMTLRDLPARQAGAGSGAYNTMRQLGAVTGSAVIGAVMQSRVVATNGSASAFGEALIPAVIVLVIGAVAAWQARHGRAKL